MKRMWSRNELKQQADARIVALVEGGTLDNAKPVYCHPISIEGVSDNENYTIRCALLIFDDSNAEYNTYNKLTAKLDAIFSLNANAVFPITGGLFNSSADVGIQLHIAQKIYKDSNTIRIRTLRQDGTEGYFGLSNFHGATIYDGVNKIN